MIRMERYSLLLALFSSMLFGQSDRGTITGTVSDPGGAMIPGARVTATALDTNTQYKGTTTAAGEYTLLSLPVGLYRVTIENEGFKTVIRGSAPGRALTQNWRLALSSSRSKSTRRALCWQPTTPRSKTRCPTG